MADRPGRRPATRAPSPRRLRRLRRLPWARIAGGAAAAILLVAIVPPLRHAAASVTSRAILAAAAPFAPDIEDFEKLPESTEVVATDGSVLARLDKAQRREAVAIDDLPDHVVKAVLAAEDKAFYRHPGLDSTAVFRALLRTAQGRAQGGSTITQQLAKINYTARERTLTRKFTEVLYASQLEKRYSKDQLLQRYLNQVYFGEGAYGINAAAQTYFGKPAAQLTPGQAATLAGKIKAPERLDPRTRPELVEGRRDEVIDNMVEAGWLDEAAARAARSEPLELAPPAAGAVAMAPHFVEHVKREAATLAALGDTPEERTAKLFTAGYRVETTLDPKVYQATVAAVQDQLGEDGDPVTASATVAPGDGAIRSLFGGLDFQATQFDMSSLAGRQVGSAFKPFTYLTALREGIDPRSTFDGTSGRTIDCYGPQPVSNYAGEDAGGRITVDEAMARSVNVVFVELGCKVGVRDVLATAVDAGLPEDAATAQGAIFLGGLDGRGVNALEMAAAFATFTAKGVYAAPYGIARILDGRGRVVHERQPATRPVFKAEEVGILNSALMKVVSAGTGGPAAIGRPVAGKTGTTQDNIDAWFVGYTPQLSTAVWVGYAEPRPMSDVHGRAVTGGSFPARIFGQLMRAAHQGLPVKQIPTAAPDRLDLRNISPAPRPAPAPRTTAAPTTTAPPPPTTFPPGVVPPPTAAPPPTAPPPPTTVPAGPPPTGPRPSTTTSAPTTTTTAVTTTTTTTAPP